MKIWNIFKEILIENEVPIDEEYPSSWNIDEFKKLKSFNQRIQYCQQHLQRISSGSSRIVYKIDDEKVLKLARNQKGLIQNEKEIDIGRDYYIQDIVAKVFENDEKNLWLEMELVKKVTPQIFKNITGVEFKQYCDGISYEANQLNYSTKSFIQRPEFMDALWENEFTYEIFKLLAEYDILPGDLRKLNSYGLVTRNGHDTIVIIDFGMTIESFKTYY